MLVFDIAMPPRVSVWLANRGRGRGGGRGRGRGHYNEEVENTQDNEEVGNNSVAESPIPNRGGRGRGRAGGRGRGCGRGRHNEAASSNQKEDEHMEEEGGSHSAAVSDDAPRAARGMTLTRWTSMRLDTFDGSGTPVNAADWLRKMEKYMRGSRMTPEEKVTFMPFQLTGQADIWWDGVVEAWNPDRGAITWEVFLQQFRAKYYPESFRDKMSDELNNIQQGSKTVDEYEREFSSIVRFVPSVANDEREKARKFFRGLNARYREVMGRNPPTIYLNAVEEAQGMEVELQITTAQKNRFGNVTGNEQKRAHQEGGENSQRPPFKKYKQNQVTQPSSKPRQWGSQPNAASRPTES
jgi:hypothetical protein